MRYLKALNLWDEGTHAALITGQLRLQVGQWVYCGSGRPSRFVGVDLKSGTIDAVHFTGTGASTLKKFRFRALMAKLNKQYEASTIDAVQFRDAGRGAL